jgi:hypothetical protein
VLFVIAVAFISYSEIKERFDAAAAVAAKSQMRHSMRIQARE